MNAQRHTHLTSPAPTSMMMIRLSEKHAVLPKRLSKPSIGRRKRRA